MWKLFSCLTLSVIGFSANAEEAVSPPVLKPGVSFEMRVIDPRTGIESDRFTQRFMGMENAQYQFVMTNAHGGIGIVTRDTNFNPMRTTPKGNSYLLEIFKWPLTIGESHKYSFHLDATSGNDNDATLEGFVTVEGREEITVPAGTFDTYKISIKGSWHQNNYSGPMYEAEWYAPAIGYPVKSEYYDGTNKGRRSNWAIIEMVSYQPAP